MLTHRRTASCAVTVRAGLDILASGDASLCVRKTGPNLKIDQDFFRMDIKGEQKDLEYTLVKLPLGGSKIVAVACGNAHSLLLTAHGLVFSLYRSS
jgi:hypothetical protein